MRQRYTGSRLWALFEPRSATSKRNCLQNELIAALSDADASIIAPVFMPDKVPLAERLDVEVTPHAA